jgi:hypothetical protein
VRDRGWPTQHDRCGNGGSARGREEGTQEGTRGIDGRGEEEEAHAFPKNTHGGDQENHPGHHDYNNLTLEELVKFMDVVVASKYRSDLMNFTHTITEEVHCTLDTFKTDLQNTLPWQIRSVV